MKKKLLLRVLGVLILLHLPVMYGFFRSFQVQQYLAGLDLHPEPSPFQDVRGVFHVHSAQGGHSLGTYPEIVQAALAARCRFVFLTEHPKDRKILSTLQEESVLLIYGSEQEEGGGCGFWPIETACSGSEPRFSPGPT